MKTTKYNAIKANLASNYYVGNTFDSLEQTMKLINALTVNKHADTTLTEDQRWGLFIVVLNNFKGKTPQIHSQLRHFATEHRKQYGWSEQSQADCLIFAYNHYFIGTEDRLSAH